MGFLVKNRDIGKKIAILVKNRDIGQKSGYLKK